MRARIPRTRSKQCSLTLVMLATLWAFLHLLFHSKPAARPIGIAHRGAAGLAPENTLAAVRTGLKHQADMIEIDLQRSQDGELVLMHDTTVDRTTDGIGHVHELTASALAELDAGSSFSAAFAGEVVPTLRDVLDALRDAPATLAIEVKDPARYPDIADDLATLLQAYAAHMHIVVLSFDHDWLARFNAISPQTRTVALSIIAPRITSTAGVNTIAVHWSNVLLDPTLIWRAHRADKRVFVWTVNRAALMRAMVWLGVDGVTTNRPEVWNDVR